VSFTIQKVAARAKHSLAGIEFQRLQLVLQIFIWTSENLSGQITQNVTTGTTGIFLTLCM